MGKSGLKTFKVNKRFELWLETTVRATDIEAALSMGKAMTVKDFVTIPDQTELIDETEQSGMSIGEE